MTLARETPSSLRVARRLRLLSSEIWTAVSAVRGFERRLRTRELACSLAFAFCGDSREWPVRAATVLCTSESPAFGLVLQPTTASGSAVPSRKKRSACGIIVVWGSCPRDVRVDEGRRVSVRRADGRAYPFSYPCPWAFPRPAGTLRSSRQS